MLDSEPVLRNHGPALSDTMRLHTVMWIKEVCTETNSDLVVMPLAVSYFDRFLAVRPLPTEQYQALGAACMLLASKMKAPVPLTPKRISDYTDHGVSAAKIMVYLFFQCCYFLLTDFKKSHN